MDNPQDSFDDVFFQKLAQAADLDISSEDATAAMKNLETLSKSRPPVPELALTLLPEPTTRRGKVKRALADALNNETAQVAIKSGASLLGVVTVVWAGIHRDHVIEKTALAQANQPQR